MVEVLIKVNGESLQNKNLSSLISIIQEIQNNSGVLTLKNGQALEIDEESKIIKNTKETQKSNKNEDLEDELREVFAKLIDKDREKAKQFLESHNVKRCSNFLEDPNIDIEEIINKLKDILEQ